MGSKYYGPIQANDHSRLHLGDNYFYGDQERLKHVPGALFDAYGLEHHACHPETRRELLGEIEGWAELSAGESIFWLNGMAGTGKSTIAYTVAERLNQQRSTRATLGASFFFRRGERDRTSTALFIPTIVRQLRQKIPNLATHIDQAISTDPDICNKALGEQFNKLLREPLQKLGDFPSRRTYVVVVDALDECENEDDIRTLLQLWSHLSHSPHISMRLFLTSRPELAIRLAIAKLPTNAHYDMILHEIPPPSIEHDIFVFVRDQFAQIRDEYNVEPLSGTPLPDLWPGDEVVQEITDMAVPLFIIAVTVCRFLQDRSWDPPHQLHHILQSRRTGQLSHITQTYLSILKQVVSSLGDTSQTQVYTQFRLIIGAIITLAEPLSCLNLSMLLDLSVTDINLRLRPLYSVLQVPQQPEVPIRPLHLSFGEFLSSNEIQDQPFYIDRTATHGVLLAKCLDLLSQPSIGLSENMCQLSYPGQPRHDLASAKIHDRLPPAMQYACRYWTYHAQQSAIKIHDNDRIHQFLQKFFLHWLEALSLLGCLTDALQHTSILQSLLVKNGSTHLTVFLKDARRFILANRYIADLAPLQLYSSAVVFAPQASTVRQIYRKTPKWIRQAPITPDTWSAELQKLEGHTNLVTAVAFSPDGSLLASASRDHTVRLWDAKTGREVQKLEGHTSSVSAVAFSPDGSLLASASWDRTVRLWDARTGREVRKLEGHTDSVTAVAFSPDGSLLASASRDRTVRLWDTKTGQQRYVLKNNPYVNKITFSRDGQCLLTNRGIIHIDGRHSISGSQSRKTSEDIMLKDTWIQYGNQNVLWLPHEYRSDVSAVHGNILAIGRLSGLVSFFQIEHW